MVFVWIQFKITDRTVMFCFFYRSGLVNELVYINEFHWSLSHILTTTKLNTAYYGGEET